VCISAVSGEHSLRRQGLPPFPSVIRLAMPVRQPYSQVRHAMPPPSLFIQYLGWTPTR